MQHHGQRFPDGRYSFGRQFGPNGPEFLYAVRLAQGEIVELVPNGQDNPQLNNIYRMSANFLLRGGRVGWVGEGLPYLIVPDEQAH